MKFQVISILIGMIFGLIVFNSCSIDGGETTISFLSSEEFKVVSRSLDIENELPNYSNTNESDRDYEFDTKALLGRILFYDTHLSIDNTVSCASCHDQKLGFADDKAFSEGIDGQVTERNSIAFSAVGSDDSESNPYFGGEDSFGASMFWDHRASSVTDQLKETIENEVEMGMPLDQLPGKLSNLDYYQILFRKAYSDGLESYAIQEEDILDALLKFMQSLNPSNSKYDQVTKSRFSFLNTNETPVFFTAKEQLGESIYESKCGSCHGRNQGQPVSSTRNNGLSMVYTDLGDGTSRFKVPALRNVALSGPYMHDGRFETLEEVIEHYSSGIRRHQNLDDILIILAFNQGPNPLATTGGFNFTNEEKDALLQFLNTMTDESFINDQRLSSPF